MVKLGTLLPELQAIRDELSADVPADIRNLSTAEQRAELEARGLLDPQEAVQFDQRRRSRRRPPTSSPTWRSRRSSPSSAAAGSTSATG